MFVGGKDTFLVGVEIKLSLASSVAKCNITFTLLNTQVEM